MANSQIWHGQAFLQLAIKLDNQNAVEKEVKRLTDQLVMEDQGW